MKTIFITISRGSIAKNILHNDFYQIIKDAGLRIVILSPAFKYPDFIKEFDGENIFFEPLFEHKWTKLDYFFIGIHKALVYNESTVLRDSYGILDKGETNIFRKFFKRIIFKPLSSFGWLKELVRFSDYIFCPDKKYKKIFEQYKPELVFSTNPMENDDSYVLKAAKKFTAKTMAMPKSWDGLSKVALRVKPDHICLWGEGLIEPAIKFQNIEKKNISVVGVPQYDIYARPDMLSTKEEFFKHIGADPERELLIFGSTARYSPFDPEIVEMILKWIEKGELNKKCALFIRPCFSSKDDEKKFVRFIGRQNVVVDRWFARNNVFRDMWDYSTNHLVHFADLLRHSAMMINYCSTLTIDAAANDKPVISLLFDGKEKREYGESIARWYDTTHYKAVVALNGTAMANSPEELKSAINAYLENPNLYSEGRSKLRDNFCYKIDGNSGKRLAEILLEILLK